MKRTGHVLCLDFGTSSIKGGLIDASGRLEVWERESLLADPAADLAHWQPGVWTRGFKRIVERMKRSGLFTGAGLRAIVLSGNGPTVVPVDRRGLPLGEALLWVDTRAVRTVETSSFFLPKISWIKVNEPKVYDEAGAFLSFPEFMNLYLTGEQATITPSEGFKEFIWTEEQIGSAGLDPRKFPRFVRIGERVGSVGRNASSDLGLPEGLPVIAGGSDFLMSLLGTATVVPGRTCDRAGTSEGINHCIANPVRNERVRCLPHVIDGLYNAAGILSSTGRSFEWFRDISGQHGKDYREMMSEIVAVGHSRSTPRFFPSLHTGEVWEFADAIFAELNPEHRAPEMGRAVVESIGFGVRNLIESLEKSGCSIGSLRACGGQARNEIWNQMKADITGKPIVVPEVVDAELVGDACAGLVGLGDFSSLTEASGALVRLRQTFEPNPDEHRRFTEEYLVYEEICRRMVAVAEASNRGSAS